MLESYNDVLTVQELTKILSIGRNSVYNLLKENRIKHIRVGNKIIIPKQCVIDFLQSAS